MKIKATPITTTMAPAILFQVAFSWNNMKAAIALKSGVVEDMIIACESKTIRL